MQTPSSSLSATSALLDDLLCQIDNSLSLAPVNHQPTHLPVQSTNLPVTHLNVPDLPVTPPAQQTEFYKLYLGSENNTPLTQSMDLNDDDQPIAMSRAARSSPTVRRSKSTSKTSHSVPCILGIDPILDMNVVKTELPVAYNSTTLALDVITRISESVDLDLLFGNGPHSAVMDEFHDETTLDDVGYTIFEHFHDLGLTRPLRPWERVVDVLRSWDTVSRNTLSLRRDGYYRAPEYALLGPPIHFSSVLYCETRSGKFKKRVVELRLGTESAKFHWGQGTLTSAIANDGTNVASVWVNRTSSSSVLCSLAHFDVYTCTTHPNRPTKYAFALKNASARMSQVEDSSDFVKYLYAESAADVKGWVMAIRSAKAHVDQFLNPDRFESSPVDSIEPMSKAGPLLKDLTAPAPSPAKHAAHTPGKPLLDFTDPLAGFNLDRPTLLLTHIKPGNKSPPSPAARGLVSSEDEIPIASTLPRTSSKRISPSLARHRSLTSTKTTPIGATMDDLGVGGKGTLLNQIESRQGSTALASPVQKGLIDRIPSQTRW